MQMDIASLQVSFQVTKASSSLICKIVSFLNFILCDSACLRSRWRQWTLSFKRYELFTKALVHKSKEILLGMVTHVSRVRKPPWIQTYHQMWTDGSLILMADRLRARAEHDRRRREWWRWTVDNRQPIIAERGYNRFYLTMQPALLRAVGREWTASELTWLQPASQPVASLLRCRPARLIDLTA